MIIEEGAEVFTADGKKVGEVDRIVIDPASKEVTHVLVQKGFLFTTDKVVPINLISTSGEDRVTLREDAGDLEALPDFEETHYVPVNEVEAQADAETPAAPAMYWYPPVGYTWWGMTGGMPSYIYPPIPPYVVQTERNVPEGTVALKEGAKVLSADGEHVGNVEAVLTGVETDRATHLLVSKGVLLNKTVLIPTTWISTIMEKEVHLVVGSELLKDLPAYAPPELGS